MKSLLTREEVLAHLTATSFPWGQISAVNDWTFQDGQYVHAIHEPITLDDVNRAKIVPNTKIRILSPKHSEYVQKMALEAGFYRFISNILGEPYILFNNNMQLMYGNFIDHPYKEIFIELPKKVSMACKCLTVGEGKTLGVAHGIDEEGKPYGLLEQPYMPKVGDECECKFYYQSGDDKFVRCYTVGMTKDKKWLVYHTYHNDGLNFASIKNGTVEFRPLKDERAELMSYLSGGDGCPEKSQLDALDSVGWGEVADRIIKAGYSKRDASQNETSN